ncbi:MAG: helicase-associated domain-containing protein [Chloroflexota bacterium]|nr:helicase-associated domain-containing protein [Chloroflexota bacterium]
MRSLNQCLLDTNLVRLRTIARFWGVELTANRQRDIATQLAEAMATPEAVAGAWDTLPDDQRQALESLLAAGDRMVLRVFTRQWGEIRTMGPGRMERERPWQEPISSAEGLWYKGFIFRAFDQGVDEAYEVVFVPPELTTHLPAPPPSPPTITIKPASRPITVRSTGVALLDDACTLLAYLQNEQLRPSPNGDWPARHEARLARQMHDPTPTRLSLLRHLAQHLGWLRVTDSLLLRPDPGPVTAWLQAPTNQQRAALAEFWRDDPAWNDLFHIPTLHPENTGAWRNDPLLARQATLHHLKTCVPNTWYTLNDFVTAIKQADPDFQRPSGDYTTWYIRDAATGAYLSGFESWDRVEGALIHYLITKPLAWLGLTDVGTDALDDPPTAFRLTPAGAALLGLAEPPPEPEPAPLALRPDFTVLVPPAQRYERFQLARVADWVHTPTLRSPTPTLFIYQLTPASLERARRQGIPVARVLEFLGQVTGAGTPVPRFVEAALTRWEARGTEARLERVLLLRLSNEEMMAQITSSPHIRRLIHERIGPKAALVRERDWPRLVVALGEMGLLADVVALEKKDTELTQR